MSTSMSLRRAVRGALLSSAATAVVIPAHAQDEAMIQEIVVTGSRISQPNLETTSPVMQVTSEDVLSQGVTKIEDLVNQLPQAFAAQNATVANGATGAATVNLRGLGSARTLVLVDGRRMPYGSVDEAAADLNQIPTALVERVEVLTGGASAVYGSDAIAGVVNFIMKKDFEGVQIDAQYSLYQHNNDFGGPGATKLRDVIAARGATNPSQFQLPDDNVTDGNGVQTTITFGVNTDDGRGNLTAYATYQDNKEILQRDRDFSACTLANDNPTVSFACGGSGTAYPGTFRNFATGASAFNYTIDETTGNFRPFNAGLDQYNFGPLSHFLRPDTRYSLGAMGHYELAEFADVYTQLMFTDVRSVAQIAPGGIFLGDQSTINCDNPFLNAPRNGTTMAAQIGCTPAMIAAGESTALYIGRRNVEGGGRRDTFHNSSFRTLVGARGEIVEGWSYDASVQFSRTSAKEKTLNYFSKPKMLRALDVVADPATGAPVCRSVLDGTDPNCVPYNAFAIGGVTNEALAYVQAPGLQDGVIDQNVAIGVITGDLGSIGGTLPWADESIRVAFGIENRRDYLENTTDDLQANDLLSGAGGAQIAIEGSANVNDYFAEARIPIVQGKPGAEQLSFDTAYRYSDYSSGIQTDAYKFGADWAPMEDVRFRASYQRAVRAPNVIELFTAQGFNLFDIDGDPCGAELADETDASFEECVASGVPAALVGSAVLDSPAGQYRFNQGGNTGLDPEISDTYTYGIVFTPRFAPGLSVSVDYFDIEVEDLISTFGAGNTLTACYAYNDAAACERIHRHPDNGTLWIEGGHVDDLNINIGGLKTSGVDLNLNYSGFEVGNMGSLTFNLTGTYLREIITDPGAEGFPEFDCAGLFAGACVSSLTTAVNPELRTRFRLGWQTPWNLDVALTHRYISEVEQEGAPANRIDRKLSAEHYFDLFGSWNVTEMTNVRVGVNNVLDNDPSLSTSVGTTGNGNTYPQVYDALGRYLFAGATVKF
jgi:iron complex outermembrane recepter protein